MASPIITQFKAAGATKVVSLWNNQYALADEGTFFLASNPTVGTAITQNASIQDDSLTSSITHGPGSPMLFIHNNWPVTDPVQHRIYLQYLRLAFVAAPTGASDWRFAFRGDTTVNRYVSGGSAITPVNCNMDEKTGSNALIYAGALTAMLPSTAGGRLLAHGIADFALPIIGDQHTYTFGDVSMPTNILAATAIKQITIPVCPIVLGPGQNVTFEQWGTSNGGSPSFEFELVFVERPAGQ